MRRLLIQITALLLFTVFSVSAQEVIVADSTKGCDSLTVQFILDNAYDISIYSSIVWNFGDGESAEGALNVVHRYTNPGIYNVTCLLDGARGIRKDTFITVSISPHADFTFKDISGNELEYKYEFEPRYFTPLKGIGLNYTWRFPDGSEIYDSIAEYTFEEEDIYEVFLQIVDENGCIGSVTDSIPVSKNLMIPNVFTPNGDQINDYFTVTTPGEEIWLFRVLSDNGLEVFSSNSTTIVWDGRILGEKMAPQGIYFYQIVNESDSDERYNGFIYLFR